MVRIGVTGYKGRLGTELVKRGCLPLDCDITSKKSIRMALRDVKPEMVIHCAAFTDVDACEDNRDEAFEVNAHGTENLKVCFEGRIIYISTDYIFDGKRGCYFEYAKPAQPENLCWYGYTKLLGEQLLGCNDTIIRTTMLYGSPVKDDFVTTILQRLELMDYFSVTKSLRGNPTYVPHLAEALMELVQRPFMPHILNIVGRDIYSRFEFAQLIADTMGYADLKGKIKPTNYVGKTKRPRHAGLATVKARTLNIPIYTALDGLREFGKEYKSRIYQQLRMEI